MILRRLSPLALSCALAVGAGGAASAADVTCPRMSKAPTIDGDLADWAGLPTLTMSDASSVEDLVVSQAGLAWDDANLYVSLRMKDHHLLNDGKGDQIVHGDCAELRLLLPAGDTVRLAIAPISGGGTPALHLSRRAPDKGPASELASATDPKVEVKGVRWAVRNDADGWTVEAAVPLALIGLTAGAGYPFVLVGWDHDQENDWATWHRRSESANQKKPDYWPRLVLTK